MAKKQKYYVVWEGHEKGVFDSWAICEKSIKNYPAAKYKSFESLGEAQAAFKNSPFSYLNKNITEKTVSKTKKTRADIIFDSICVDAACSGNPGDLEYRGVNTKTKAEIFHVGPLACGTNNLGEFLGLVHGLAYLQKLKQFDTPIYSDSKTAISWIQKGKAKTTLEANARNIELFELLARAEKWLTTNTFSNPILKWETEDWGEIPADFGRK